MKTKDQLINQMETYNDKQKSYSVNRAKDYLANNTIPRLVNEMSLWYEIYSEATKPTDKTYAKNRVKNKNKTINKLTLGQETILEPHLKTITPILEHIKGDENE